MRSTPISAIELDLCGSPTWATPFVVAVALMGDLGSLGHTCCRRNFWRGTRPCIAVLVASQFGPYFSTSGRQTSACPTR